MLFAPAPLDALLLISIFCAIVYIRRNPESLLAKYWQYILLALGLAITAASLVLLINFNRHYKATWPDPSYQPFEPAGLVLFMIFSIGVAITIFAGISIYLKQRRFSKKKHK